MRAVAGEVLADRQLQPAERAQHEPDRDHRVPLAADEEAADEQHQRDQDHQLHERERPPGRRRPLVGRATRARACGRGFAAGRGGGGRSTALLALRAHGRGRRASANGQPEESLTRHQPISIPRMPHRGRECQWRQPGSPMSSSETRTQR